MEASALRAEFPVLERLAYLNAGTDGPIPARAYAAADARARAELEDGRAGERHRASLEELVDGVRRELSVLLGAQVEDVALTHSTTDGINLVLTGLELGSGDEVLTSDEEHPGLLAPLAALAARTGVALRVAPFGAIADAVSPSTRLVACSHVSWVSGRVVDAAALAAAPAPVLLDGAQGLGAVDADVRRLGCDYYAAAGQKWLCGPDGTGCLYVHPERRGELAPTWPGYQSLADPERAAELDLHADARRFDRGAWPGASAAWWLAAIELLASAGWAAVCERAAVLAERFADALAGHGREVVPRGRSTLVSWHDPDPMAAVARLAAAGVIVRDIPGRGLVRASIGAWSSEEELDRVAALAAGA